LKNFTARYSFKLFEGLFLMAAARHWPEPQPPVRGWPGWSSGDVDEAGNAHCFIQPLRLYWASGVGTVLHVVGACPI